MGRVALRGIRAHVVRFLLSLLAVALGVAFVAGTFSLRTMLSSTFDGIVDAGTPGDAYVRAEPAEGASVIEGTTAGPAVPMTLADEIAALDGVAHAIPEAQGSIVLVGADGTAVQSTQAPSLVFSYLTDDPSLEVVEGRGPERAGEIALETATLASSGLEVGDTTQVVLGGQLSDAEVVGRFDMGAPMAGATLVVVDPGTGYGLFAPDGEVADIAVYAEDGTTPAELVDAIAPLVTGDLQVVTGDELRDENKAAIGEMLGFVTTFLLVFAAIALFVGAFIISNTFAMSVRQRMREFALLRAVGASPAQVFTSILVQAAVVGLVGSALGIAGGLGLVQGLKSVFEAMGMDLAGDIPVDGATIGVSLAVGTVVSVLAAAVPARRAALVPPVEAMRDDVAVPERSIRVRAVLGALLTGLGAAAVLAAVLHTGEETLDVALGAGAAAVLVGVLVLAPGLARAVLGVLSWPFVRLLRPVGRLARGNVVRNPRRTASTAGALMIGMALVGGVSVIATSAQASVAGVVESQLHTDLVLQSATRDLPKGAIADVDALPEVGGTAAFAFAPLEVSADGEEAGTQYVAGVRDDLFDRTIEATTIDGDLASLADGEAAVQEDPAKEQGWAVGDTLRIVGPAGPQDVTVGAVFTTNVIGAPVVVGTDVLDALVPPEQQLVDLLAVDAAPGVGADELKDAVTAAVAPYVVVSVLTQDEFVSNLADQVNQVLVILYALLGLSVVIAVLGIVNTLALSVIERTREIGLLRAVGLGRLQLAGTVTVESVLTAVFGTVVGLVVGVALASALPSVYADDGLSELVIPWGNLLAMVGLAVVVGVLAALWPATRAARMRVLDAVSYE
ncbi:FtsX-like permease family protein [Cellulomonas sp. ACRRI]|uniref:ABC transporter permease n=1 Tax=Cellulomonas sp. ACRRI TaxID=2918188 RepID=UPI001EF1FF56|nr:FtsX family ABC transporter permease [Cellulomonas sp. ACRRI]MCG7284821.1 FtsX-like permease family protein [Cellulomonas sp. ACRRI]